MVTVSGFIVSRLRSYMVIVSGFVGSRLPSYMVIVSGYCIWSLSVVL